MKPTLDRIIDSSFRNMREKFRDCHRLWVKGELVLMIAQAEELDKSLKSFIRVIKEKEGKRR
jgi:hypothetical protein